MKVVVSVLTRREECTSLCGTLIFFFMFGSSRFVNFIIKIEISLSQHNFYVIWIGWLRDPAYWTKTYYVIGNGNSSTFKDSLRNTWDPIFYIGCIESRCSWLNSHHFYVCLILIDGYFLYCAVFDDGSIRAETSRHQFTQQTSCFDWDKLPLECNSQNYQRRSFQFKLALLWVIMFELRI